MAGDLAGHWRFDEGSGTAIHDSSGNNMDGTIINGTGSWADGAAGIRFANPSGLTVGGANGYVEIGTDSQRIDLANRSFSISFWAKRSGEGAGWIICQGSSVGNQGLHVGFRDSTHFSLAFWSDDLNVAIPHDTQWNQWTVTYDVYTKNQSVFRNGSFLGSRTASDHFKSSGDLLVGKRFDGADPFYGAIDDLQIYTRVLSAEEINALAAIGAAAALCGETAISVASAAGACIVAYDANGGTGTPPSEAEKEPGEEFAAAAADSFTPPAGKQFKEWNTRADGAGTGYAPGATVAMPLGNLTLYAIREDLPWEGDGSEATPYRVASAAHLNDIRNKMGPGVHFEQTADIDLSNYANWTPIGEYASPFKGNYDGAGKTTSDLTVNRPGTDGVGLFGFISGGGKVENLRIDNAYVAGNVNVGILAGIIADGAGTIKNCSTGGTVYGVAGVGGLLGRIEHTNALVSKSFSTAAVTGYRGKRPILWRRGGPGGPAPRGTIRDSYAAGPVSGGETGGLAGSTNNVNGTPTIERCYAVGSVTGQWTGGLVGDTDGSFPITDSFYDRETTGQSDDTGKGTPMLNAQMKQHTTFTSAGWDFANTWKIDEGVSYPTLQWQPWSTDEVITADWNALTWDVIKGTNSAVDNITADLVLPAAGARGSAITWSAEPAGYIDTLTGSVTRPEGADQNVTVTAAVYYAGGTERTKDFNLTVKKRAAAIASTAPTALSEAAANDGSLASGTVVVTIAQAKVSGAESNLTTENIGIDFNDPALTYTVTYNGNGNTGGSVPVDNNSYQQGVPVTVLGNTGNLVKTAYTFAGWNTAADRSGTTYAAGAIFPMGSADMILYAIWESASLLASYSDLNHAQPCGDFSGDINTVYLAGNNFIPDALYHIAYYDADGHKKGTDSKTSDGSGHLSSSFNLTGDSSAVSGTWHSVVYLYLDSPPASYDPDDPDMVVQLSFTVQPSAIPEFSGILASVLVMGMCAAISPQVCSSFISFASFSTTVMSSMSTSPYYQDNFNATTGVNAGLAISLCLIALLIALELSGAATEENKGSALVWQRFRIKFSTFTWILFIIFIGIVYTKIVMILTIA